MGFAIFILSQRNRKYEMAMHNGGVISAKGYQYNPWDHRYGKAHLKDATRKSMPVTKDRIAAITWPREIRLDCRHRSAKSMPI
jgi:hypothetical protein